MGRLVRLELFNFKSYKGHHVLLFGDANFTSIIGPNGSGKSNSMDAISFVLGIKSSHLRSTHLRDLIYRGRILKTSKINADGSAADQDANGDAGSDNDQPDASSQRRDATFAWVMAVYEDDAGDEQFWKRIISSSGSSEYRINNHQVDAKKYNEVLESENILIKARNFLVFQGDVEAIASQSPKDLTRLVEQISGSLEYKADYDRLQEEAEKANEDQMYKSTQRRSINTEIKTFQEQKKEADNYNEKAQERDDAIVKHVLWKLHHLQRAIDESTSEIQRHQDELKEFRRNMQQHETRLDEAKRDQAKAAKEVHKAERTIKNTDKQIEDKMHDLVPIDAKISASNANLEKYNKRISDVTRERDNQTQFIKQLEKDLSTVSKAQTKWTEDFNKQAQKQGKQLSDADLKEFYALKAQVNTEASANQTQLDTLTRQRNTDADTLANLKSSVDEAERQIQKLETELAETHAQREQTESTMQEASAGVDEKKKEISKMNSERVKVSQRQTELEEKLQQVASRLLEADNGRKQTAKEAKAKDTLNSLKRTFPGVRGRVHELCKPKQKKFEVAVSTVLGRDFDSIVVDTEKTARDCLTYLREQRIGEATCIPLDTLQVSPINSKLKGLHPKMRLAIDTIDYDSAVERAMLHACGSAVICDDMKTAKHLMFEKNIQAKAVVLDGTIIHKAGLMTGGRGPQDRQERKWDDAEVDNLHKAKDNILAELTAMPKSHQSTRDMEDLRGEHMGLEQRLAFARDEFKAYEKNEQSKKKQLQFHKSQLKDVKPKHQDQAKKVNKVSSKIETLEKQIAGVEDKVFSAFCQRLKFDNIRSYEALQGSLQEEGAQKKLEFTKQKTRLESQLSFEKTRLQTTTDRLSSLEKQAKRDGDLVHSLEEEKQAMQDELESIEANVESMKAEVEKLKAAHVEKGERVQERRREVQRRSKDMDFVSKEITRHENDIQRNASQRYQQLRKAKIEEIKLPLTADSMKLDTLPLDELLQGETERDPNAMDVDDDVNATLLETPNVQDHGIELDFDELDEELLEDASESTDKQLTAAISSLATELSKLNPNMRAMDRLSGAQARLKSSESDYRAAQRLARDTVEAFEDVRVRRAELFNKAFTHISEQIRPVYKGLTQSAQHPLGGQAYLDNQSTDDDTPFLGGLKYHAMPPLKRFRDMDALSGGEKTIAALALLFAIHSYAPSPFFVLDEVDAALDNANVAKVAKYIKDNSRPGMQFIVISLKTSLFQESDCLVGVLRDQGANTSKAVTLDLRKYQPA